MEGLEVGSEITFSKEDLPMLFNLARECIDDFVTKERIEMGLESDTED